MRPNQIASIPDFNALRAEVIEQHGLEDAQAAEQTDTGFSEQIRANAHKPGGLYQQLREKGFRWSHYADRWFYMGKNMPAHHAVMIQILLAE